MGTEDQEKRATERGDRTGQRALLTRGMPVDDDKDQRPPERKRVLNTCSHQGGGRRWGAPHPAARAYDTQPGDGGGALDLSVCP